MSFWEKVNDLDRRIIYLIIGLTVFIPLLFNVTMESKPTQPVENIYDKINSLEEDDVVLVSFDYAASSLPELQPMANAVIDHLFRNDIKVVGMALWPVGVGLGTLVMEKKAAKYDKEYGKDYVNLGYKSGGLVVIDSMGGSVKKTFPTDKDGVALKDLPIMKHVNKLDDFSLAVTLSAGDPGLRHWVMVASDKFGLPVAGGCTAVSAPQFFAYYNSGQLLGLMGGLRGAAEYENLIDVPGTASAGMSAQTVAHLMIIIFIIIGNISMFIIKRKKEKEKRK
ncbi:MAG: hypothetical protein FXF47_06715 [Candidatus Mcinerneyibacterium aminivorans]|uniref:Uncharacterized protein n=1 Tax=Candidatus Mcinerneyibacterium aminivorans TaxID=2703815 RepID=A0A5D0MH90_9BACT|nr:MAG: hypothetical protein FXF47_06715 [Candidatus Mcinerneyibacterium aminivorans]